MIQNLFFFFFRRVGSLSQPRLNIFTVGNMRVMICLGQGGLRSLSASSSGFSLRLRTLHRSSRSIRFLSLSLSASSCVSPQSYMRMSSAMLITPSSPSRTSLCLCWNSSGAELMPKGSLNHLTLPIGVCMVVSRLDSSSRLTCVNPTSASTSVKRLALTNLWRFSSNVGIGYSGLLMALLSVLTGSMHILIFFPGRSTAIISEHHGVGSATGARHPSSIISWIRLEMTGTLFTGYRRRPAWTGRMSGVGCALDHQYCPVHGTHRGICSSTLLHWVFHFG